MKRSLALACLLLPLAIGAGCLDETLILAAGGVREPEQGGDGGEGDLMNAGPAELSGAAGLGGAAGDTAGGAAGEAGESVAGTGHGGEGNETLGCNTELCGAGFCAGGVGDCVLADGLLDCTGEVGDTSIFAQADDKVVLLVDMAHATELRLVAEICDPTGYVLHLGDSLTNDGSDSESQTSTNDAEILVRGTRLDVFANDLSSQDGSRPSLLNDEGYVSEQGCTTRALSVSDQVVEDLHDDALYYESPSLLRIDPAGDLKGAPDALWWLGLNHVVRTDVELGRVGTGGERVRLCFTRALSRQCALNGYGRDPEIGECASTLGEWQGCASHGCAVCADLLADYPSYLAHHPCCESAVCPAQPSACNSYCPAPTEADR